jgi:hypothetical protein
MPENRLLLKKMADVEGARLRQPIFQRSAILTGYIAFMSIPRAQWELSPTSAIAAGTILLLDRNLNITTTPSPG